MEDEHVSDAQLIDEAFAAGDNVIVTLRSSYRPEQLKVIEKIGAFIGSGMSVKEACILSFMDPDAFTGLMAQDPGLRKFIVFKETVFKARLMRTVTLNATENKSEKSAGWMLERRFAREFNAKPVDPASDKAVDLLEEGIRFVRENGDLTPLVAPKPQNDRVRDVQSTERLFVPSRPLGAS